MSSSVLSDDKLRILKPNLVFLLLFVCRYKHPIAAAQDEVEHANERYLTLLRSYVLRFLSFIPLLRKGDTPHRSNGNVAKEPDIQSVAENSADTFVSPDRLKDELSDLSLTEVQCVPHSVI